MAAVLPTLEFPSGTIAKRFIEEIKNMKKGQISDELYMKFQNDNSLLMNIIVKNSLELFKMLNKEMQINALGYIRRMISLELTNCNSPIINQSLILLQLSEWYKDSNVHIIYKQNYIENKEGKIWCLNE